MAEKKPARNKRRVKNPETFRERMQKSVETTGKRKKTPSRLKKSASPLARKTGKIFQRRPFRIIGKVLLPTYLRKSWQELTQVAWPSWKEGRRLTFAVLVFAVIFGAAIAAVDWGLDKVFQQLLLK